MKKITEVKIRKVPPYLSIDPLPMIRKIPLFRLISLKYKTSKKFDNPESKLLMATPIMERNKLAVQNKSEYVAK